MQIKANLLWNIIMLQLFRQFNSVNICGDWYWLKPCLTNVFLYKTDDKNLKYYTYGKKDLQQTIHGERAV